MKVNFKENILRKIRTTVSADKQRYTDDYFDVDLTYITDRLIAMSFPAEGVEATYRNDINDVSMLLASRHSGHFKIYNLSQRIYDYTKFEDKVLDWCGWPDHHNPPLLLLFKTIKSIHDWLLDDNENVAVVHCLAGKGRTGTIISCYMLFAGLFSTNIDSRKYFASKRSMTNWGVAGPAQIRYVEYFEYILRNGYPKKNPIKLVSILMNKVPNMSSLGRGAATLGFTIYDYNVYCESQPVIWSDVNLEKTYTGEMIVIPVDVLLQGDIWVVMYNIKSWGTNRIGLIALNTGMVEVQQYQIINHDEEMKSLQFSYRVPKSEIDNAFSDKRFPTDFYLEFVFEMVPDTNEEGLAYMIQTDNICKSMLQCQDNTGGICFMQDQFLEKKLAEAKNFTFKDKTSMEHAGWLTKQGHQVKNWKRRWFVLRSNRIEYYTKPNTHSGAAGSIFMKDIHCVCNLIAGSIMPEDRIALEGCDNIQNAFVIYAVPRNYYILADNEQDREDWIEAITCAIQSCDKEFDSTGSQEEYYQYCSVTQPLLQ